MTRASFSIIVPMCVLSSYFCPTVVLRSRCRFPLQTIQKSSVNVLLDDKYRPPPRAPLAPVFHDDLHELRFLRPSSMLGHSVFLALQGGFCAYLLPGNAINRSSELREGAEFWHAFLARSLSPPLPTLLRSDYLLN